MFRVVPNRPALSAGLEISVDPRAICPPAAKAWRQLREVLFDTYRPELHYMRGPGPKWRKAWRTDNDPIRAVVKPAASNGSPKHHIARLPHPGEWHVPHQGDRASGAFDARSLKGAPRDATRRFGVGMGRP
jgi:hypothetical protein